MSHSRKFRNDGTFVPVEFGIQKREKKGYKAEYLPDDMIHIFVPNKEDQRFVYISAQLNDDMGAYADLVARYAKKAWDNEYVPVCPFMMYVSMFREGDKQTYADVQMFDMMILMHCYELWIIGREMDNLTDYQLREMSVAAQLDIPVRLVSFDEEVQSDE